MRGEVRESCGAVCVAIPVPILEEWCLCLWLLCSMLYSTLLLCGEREVKDERRDFFGNAKQMQNVQLI